jgi:hypothetical protein
MAITRGEEKHPEQHCNGLAASKSDNNGNYKGATTPLFYIFHRACCLHSTLTGLCLVDTPAEELGLVNRLGRLVVLLSFLASVGTEQASATLVSSCMHKAIEDVVRKFV